MTAPADIAAVAAELRSGRFEFVRSVGGADKDRDLAAAALVGCARGASTIVDATPVYEAWCDSKKALYLYEDHPCAASPWEWTLVCYRQRSGAIVALALEASEHPERTALWEQPDDHAIDWARVRWVHSVMLMLSGPTGDGRKIPTSGPYHAWQVAVYEDGSIADVRWVALLAPEDPEKWLGPITILLSTLNLAACRNVELIEPGRPRAEARRIARHGVVVRTLAVRPIGSRRHDAGGRGDGLVPMTTVRGHFSHYGSCCPSHEPRGLLFGRSEGKYWIPQHARGEAALGVHLNDYRVEPVNQELTVPDGGARVTP